MYANEDGRSGQAHGVSYTLESELPSNIGFAYYPDQIHHVTMRIPKSFYELDGKLRIEFQTNLGEGIESESAGFDNIKIMAGYGCDLGGR